MSVTVRLCDWAVHIQKAMTNMQGARMIAIGELLHQVRLCLFWVEVQPRVYDRIRYRHLCRVRDYKDGAYWSVSKYHNGLLDVIDSDMADTVEEAKGIALLVADKQKPPLASRLITYALSFAISWSCYRVISHFFS